MTGFIRSIFNAFSCCCSSQAVDRGAEMDLGTRKDAPARQTGVDKAGGGYRDENNGTAETQDLSAHADNADPDFPDKVFERDDGRLSDASSEPEKTSIASTSIIGEISDLSMVASEVESESRPLPDDFPDLHNLSSCEFKDIDVADTTFTQEAGLGIEIVPDEEEVRLMSRMDAALYKDQIVDLLEQAHAYWRYQKALPKYLVAEGMWALNRKLVAMLRARVSMKMQQDVATNGGKFERLPEFLVYHDRQIGQDEITAALSFFPIVHGNAVRMFADVLAAHDYAVNTPAEVDMKAKFNEFLLAVSQQRKLTMGMLNVPGHWMGIVADNRGDSPVFYICDTNASTVDEVRDNCFGRYLRSIRYFSSGQINSANTVYCGYPMQHDFTANACGPLACWMLENAVTKAKTALLHPVDMLFLDSYEEWKRITAQRKELLEAFVRERRAEVLARMAV